MGFIIDILKEVPLSAVLKERLTEAEVKFKEAESQVVIKDAKIEKLERENSDLREGVKEAEAQIADLTQKLDVLKKPGFPGAWGSQPRIKGRTEF